MIPRPPRSPLFPHTTLFRSTPRQESSDYRRENSRRHGLRRRIYRFIDERVRFGIFLTRDVHKMIFREIREKRMHFSDLRLECRLFNLPIPQYLFDDELAVHAYFYFPPREPASLCSVQRERHGFVLRPIVGLTPEIFSQLDPLFAVNNDNACSGGPGIVSGSSVRINHYFLHSLLSPSACPLFNTHHSTTPVY